MQPFKQTEADYTATAKTVAFGVTSVDYDIDKLDNPNRRKINAAAIEANTQHYKRLAAL